MVTTYTVLLLAALSCYNVTIIMIYLFILQPPPGKLLFSQTSPSSRPIVPVPQHRPPTSPRPHFSSRPHNEGMSSNAPTSKIPQFNSDTRRPESYQMVYILEEALILGTELGQGEFGSVLRGTYRTPESRVVSYHTEYHCCTCNGLVHVF